MTKPNTTRIIEAQNTKYQRATRIEHLVRTDYLDDDTDAADIALDELNIDSRRSDETIAHVVAMRIRQA